MTNKRNNWPWLRVVQIVACLPCREYTLYINGERFTYLSDQSPTFCECVDGLLSLLHVVGVRASRIRYRTIALDAPEELSIITPNTALLAVFHMHKRGGFASLIPRTLDHARAPSTTSAS